MNILFIIKVEILVFIKWSYGSSQPCWLLVNLVYTHISLSESNKIGLSDYLVYSTR